MLPALNPTQTTDAPSGTEGIAAADQPPCMASTAGPGVRRGGNAESVGLANRLAEQADQRVADALVLDASGSEKQPRPSVFESVLDIDALVAYVPNGEDAHLGFALTKQVHDSTA
jgi:hypothetical protein